MAKRFELREVRRITSHQASFRRPAWAPDGRLAIEVEGRRGGLYLLDGKGRLEGHVVEGAEPSFAPDGEQLAFTRLESDGRRSIWVCAISLPEAARRLAGGDGAAWEHPAWSPDGRSIACVSDYGNAGGMRQIWLLDPEHGDRRRVTCDPQRSDGHPAWSPDGRHIAFDGDDHADDARELDAYVIDLDTGAITRLSDGAMATRHPVFVDRRYLVAERRTDAGPTLVVLDRIKRRLHPVSADGESLREPAIRLSTRRAELRLAFVRRDEKSGRDAVWLAELRGLKVVSEAEAEEREAELEAHERLAAGLPVLPPPPPGAPTSPRDLDERLLGSEEGDAEEGR